MECGGSCWYLWCLLYYYLADALLCSCSDRFCWVMVWVFLVCCVDICLLFLVVVNSVVFAFIIVQCYLILV